MDRQYRIATANESFQSWLAESADTAEERVAEILAQMEESAVLEAPLTTYADLWHSDYSAIRAQVWHLYNDNHNTEEFGEFAQADLFVYIYRRDGKITIWFQCEWEPKDDLAEEMVEDVAWDDYDLDFNDVEDKEELADALAELLKSVWAHEAERTTDPARIEFLLGKEDVPIDWYLAKNTAVPAERLLELESRYAGGQNRNIAQFAKENPNYPEDKTEWALGDW